MIDPASEPIGLFYTWWRGDPLPALPPVPDLSLAPSEDERLVATVTGLTAREIQTRLREGHQPWLASIAGEPVAYGWVASQQAKIGELGMILHLPPGNRYLWNFVTLPARRGHGIYPRLLQAMITRDVTATRFWIGHDLDNGASARGIVRAGFHSTGILYRHVSGDFVLIPEGPINRAGAAAALLDVPLANAVLEKRIDTNDRDH